MSTIYGVFTGKEMVAENGFKYPVHGNYASKTMLVKGDELKLEIGEDGMFVFKQIQKVARKSLIGKVIKHGKKLKISAEGRIYKILDATVNHYNLAHGDKVAIIIPENDLSDWACVNAKIPA